MLPLCFVTGASGFVGRSLLPKLARHYRLRLLLRPGTPPHEPTELPHERIDGTLQDDAALTLGVRGADTVVHLAALVSFRPEDRAAMFAINCAATARLAELARQHGVRRLLHVSTISAVACSTTPRLLDETAPYNFGPLRSGYCDSKHAAELAVQQEIARGLDAVIVNPPSMYGPGDRRKGDGSLITAVLRGRIPFVPPGGVNVANVDDVCEGALAALAQGRRGERYILGGENLTGRELLQRIATIVGGTVPRWRLPAWMVRAAATGLSAAERWRGSRPPLTSEILQLGARYLWYSSAKAERELGWRAGPVDPGIRAAWASLGAAPAGNSGTPA